MARYKIGEIVASTGISPFTLKYYEKEGLLHPQTDAASGYRYYDEDELGNVMLIHRYRQWGFPVKDISTLFRGASQEKTMDLFASQMERNRAEMARLEEANRMLAEQMEWYRRFSGRQGQWEVLELGAFHYQEHYSMAPGEPPLVSVADQMEDSLEAFNTAWVPLEDGKPGSAPAVWGLLRFDRPGEDLSPRWAGSGHSFPGGRCLVFYHPEPPHPYFDPHCLERALAVAGEKRLSLAGEAYCLYLNSTATPEGATENYALVLPLKKEEKPS